MNVWHQTFKHHLTFNFLSNSIYSVSFVPVSIVYAGIPPCIYFSISGYLTMLTISTPGMFTSTQYSS